LTSREIQTIFTDINRHLGNDENARIPLNEILLSFKRNGTIKSGHGGGRGGDRDKNFDVLIPDSVIQDLAQSTQAFLKVSKHSLSSTFKILTSSSRSSSSSSPVLKKPQFLQLLDQLGCQLEESHLHLLFEIFDVTQEGVISSENLLLFLYTISSSSSPSMDMSLEPAVILSQLCYKKNLTSKDFLKNLLPYEISKTGYVSAPSFESVLKKLAGTRPGNAITTSQLADLLRYFDPNEDNRIDLGLLYSFLNLITSPSPSASPSQRIEEKLKHYLKLMRIKELSYRHLFQSSSSSDGGGGGDKISCDDLIEIVQKLNLPLVEGEIFLLFQNISKKENKQISQKIFLERIENEGSAHTATTTHTSRISRLLGSKHTSTGGVGGVGGGEMKENEFCERMYQKLCQLRSNETKRDQFREGILLRDPDLNGRITIRELERTIEKSIPDLTEAEFHLLSENLCFIDGNFKKDIDYSFLLLVLFEPIHKSQAVIECGQGIMSKMLSSSGDGGGSGGGEGGVGGGGEDSVNLRRLIALLFRNFASYDDRKCGMVTIGSAESVLKEEIRKFREVEDHKKMRKLLSAFQDPNSDCVLYPELLSFLSSCSVWNVMYRLHLVDKIRKKQGYHLADYLLKITRGEGRGGGTHKQKKCKLTKMKLFEIFLKLGILMTDTALETIFQRYRYQREGKGKGKGKGDDDDGDDEEDSIDTKAFVKDLNEMESSGDTAPMKKNRKDISSWQQDAALTKDGKCQIKEDLLKKYDTRMLRAIDLAFDLFDQNSRNEIAALDIERVLCALGQKPSPAEIEMLLEKIDPHGKDVLEYNTFMDVVLPYIRGKYDETFLPSLQRLREAFHAFDYNKDGTVSYGEFKYILSLQSEEVDDVEAEALLKILDTNDNGIVEWAEFAEMYQILRDEEAMLELDLPTRSALRKVTPFPPPKWTLTHPFLPRPSHALHSCNTPHFQTLRNICQSSRGCHPTIASLSSLISRIIGNTNWDPSCVHPNTSTR
jgi:calmodulin